MADKKVKLLNQAGDELYPRTTMDNILTAVGSTVYANLVKLNGVGKIDAQYLPSYVDDVVELVAMSATAPATCATGDLYFNTTSNKIFAATAADTWASTGTDPEKGVIYLDLSDTTSTSIWRWSGTQMIKIYQQYAVTSQVTSDSDDTAVPTAKAAYDIASSLAAQAVVEPAGSAGVATALGGVYIGENIDVNAGGTISVATGSIGTAGIVALANKTSAASTDSTDSSTAVTPAGLNKVLSSYQNKITTSNNVTISADGATISVATGSAGLGLTYVPTAANSNGVAVTNTGGTIAISGVTATAASKGVVRLASDTEMVSGTTVTGPIVASPKQIDGLIGSRLTSYQTKFTTSNGVSINGATISVATGSAGLGLTYVPTATNSNGVAVTNTGGTVTIAGVAATAATNGVVRLASSTEAVKGTTVTGAIVMDPSQVNGLITSHLSDYQVKFTNTTNVTVNGASISVASAGKVVDNTGSMGVICVDETSDNNASLSITGGTVKVLVSAAAIGTKGTIAIASDSNVKGPSVVNSVYNGGNFSGSDTAVNPAQLGSALGIAVFYQEL